MKRLNELKPWDKSVPIEVRVYRKWISYNPRNLMATGYCCILLDKEGDAIQANMDFVDKECFDKLIETNGCYKIYDYLCEHGRQQYMIVQHETTLKFGRHTKVEPIADEGFPAHYFNFVSYNQLLPRLNSKDILTDYLVSLKSVSEINKSGNPNKRTTIWRTLELENLSGDIIHATIWDDMAVNFNVEAFENLPKPVLIAITSCKVTMYLKRLQLTATSATHYYLNPNIDDAEMSLPEYHKKYNANPPLHIQRQPFSDLESEKTRNRYPLKTILSLNPRTYKSDRFTAEATIIDINTFMDWFYVACPDCSVKLRHSNNVLGCHNHGPPKKDPKHMYNFKAFIADDTAQIEVTFFSPVADSLLNIDCNKMIIELGYTDPRTIPDQILKLRGIKKVFQFHFNERSNPQNVNFIIDNVMEPTPLNKDEDQEQDKYPTAMLTKRKSTSEDKDTAATTKAKYPKPNLLE